MLRLGLLLLAVSLSSAVAAPSFSQVFMDASNCVHLQCEWRGVGEHCNPAASLQKDSSGWSFQFLNEDESDGDLLARIKGRHPLNTFTIVKNVALGEMCEERRLWCNAASQYYSERAYEEFFEQLRSPIPGLRPKLHC